jgi:hypothetical protein
MERSRANWRRELRAMISLAVPVVLSELGWIAQGIAGAVLIGYLEFGHCA